MSDILTIGKLAQATSVAARTIRYYETVGVLPPPRRTRAGYRQYGRRAVDRLLFICRARALGLPLRRLGELWDAQNGERRERVRAGPDATGACRCLDVDENSCRKTAR